MSKVITFTEAIRQATEQSLQRDSSVIVMGLGVCYKNGADGTMGTLKEEYPTRVFDTPVSEFCNTGVGVGAAVTGMKPIIHHARVEFGLFAIDQIVTQAAKWNYMFGGDNKVPIVFRLAVGRQWGNGPQHTQSLYSLFGSVPGLKVVIPSSPYMAKGLLTAAIQDNNPVVYMEPRWLYGLKEQVPEDYYELPLNAARIVRNGTALTLVTYGDGVVDALKAQDMLAPMGVDIEIVDLVSINPIDYKTVLDSVRKTGKLLCVDTTHDSFNIGSEIVSKVCRDAFECLSIPPRQLSTPNTPCPTSTSLTEKFYPTLLEVANQVASMLGLPMFDETLSFEEIHILPKIEVSTA
jgi:pyruvate dehydrogenase E1 component beta subunit